MKNLLLLSLFAFVAGQHLSAQCNANFNWEQLPNTTNIHFNSTSTSEQDIVSYHWIFGDGQEGDGASPYHEYDAPGLYLVCLIIETEGGCVDDICHEVIVLDPTGGCQASFTWEQSDNGPLIHFHSTSTSDHDIESYIWSFGDGHQGDGANPNHEYDEPGEYLVCLTIESETGCTDEVCLEITVEDTDNCNANFEWEVVPGTQMVDFFNTSTSDHDIVSYHWIFGDGQQGDGQNPTHIYAEPGEYLVCLIIESETGCVDDKCYEIFVPESSDGCEASFTWEQSDNGPIIHFHSTSTSEHDIESYQWFFGDGHQGDGANPNHEYDEPGEYHVCLVIESETGCIDEFCLDIVVEGNGDGCNANFTWEQSDNGPIIHFHSTSTSEHDIESYQWFFGDGHQGDGANPNHEYDEPGEYHVCLVIESETGCIDEFCLDIIVEGNGDGCNANFTWEQSDNGPIIHFHSTSTSEHDIISYHWNFGDGHEGDGPNPNHEYDAPGVYLVCLIIESETGCVDDICHEVVVGDGSDGCEASFTWEQSDNGPIIHFHSTSTSEHDIISYHWFFGDEHQGDGANPNHEYDQPGEYHVCLVIESETGCIDEFCLDIIVEGNGDGCNANFTWEQSDNGPIIHFHSTSTSEHEIISYHWNFGDGHEGDGPNPNHEYDAPGVYLVCLIIESETGCIDDICHEVVVGDGSDDCEASFTWEQSDNGPIIHFHSTSTSDHDIIFYQWFFGDEHQGDGANPNHEYDEPGVYLVCLVIESETGCVDEFCTEIVVEGDEPMGASFDFESEGPGHVIEFSNHSTGITPHTIWWWSFGDNTYSTERNPEHHYTASGFYVVCLVMTDTLTQESDESCIVIQYAHHISDNAKEQVRTKPETNSQIGSNLVENNPSLRYTWIQQTMDLQYEHQGIVEGNAYLYNLHGQLLWQTKWDAEQPGSYAKSFSRLDFPTGLYVLVVTLDDAILANLIWGGKP